MIEATTNSVLAGLGPQSEKQGPNNDADDLGMSTFLQLMTTQLRYQDPSAPQDSSQFLNQMAQFSSLSGIQSMENSITTAVSGMQSNRLLQASSMVGRQVLVPADLLAADQSLTAVSGQIELSGHTANLTLQVQTETGQTVRSMVYGEKPGGQI